MATKNQLVKQTAQRTGLTRAQAKEAVETFLVLIAENVAEGEDVLLTGFGSFRATVMSQQTFYPLGRDGPLEVPERLAMKFTVSQSLRKSLARRPVDTIVTHDA